MDKTTKQRRKMGSLMTRLKSCQRDIAESSEGHYFGQLEHLAPFYKLMGPGGLIASVSKWAYGPTQSECLKGRRGPEPRR